jgi:hypothetical protein
MFEILSIVVFGDTLVVTETGCERLNKPTGNFSGKRREVQGLSVIALE